MSKTVVAFGRMNPPTIGHEKLADKVASEAKRRGAMPHIYLSHTQNAKKDPLPYNVKIAIAKKAFGKAVTKSSAKNIIQIMQELEKMGHTEVTLIAGSDRVPEFKTLLNKYNGKEYNFKKIDVISAGERDPDAEGVAGMSASKLRAIAKEGDYDTFAKGMPSKLRDSDKKKVYDTIRSVMEEWDDPDPSDEELDEILSEIDNDDDLSWEWDEDQLEFDLDEERKPLTLGQRMKRRIMMKRLAPKIARMRKIKMRRKAGKEQLQKRARKSAIMILKKRVAGARGADYKNLSPSEKIGIDKLVQKRLGAVDKIAKRLMPKILKKETERVRAMRSGKVNEEFEMLMEKTKVSQDPDVDERPGTQPKKYFAGVRKKSKEARAKHFERGAKMDDDNPAAYKPAPGDAGAKTKPSKHTKKFKQMFGEQKMECPPATKDVALNTKNRNATRDNHMYGPLNVKEPGDYWEKLADKWDTTVEAAKKSKCGSCVAFDISPRMEECMPGSVSDESGRLGYCWMHHFKCHSARSCDTWATGGPIKEDEKSYQWQEKAFGKKEDISEEVTAKQISDLEKFGDRLLDKFGIDIEFSKHFADRMNDDRNNPEIKVAEIQALFKKIARKKAVNIKKHKDSEVVLKDIQKDLNLPIAIKTGKDGELDVVHKTIMRKKNFKTPNPVVQYEETQLDEGVNDPAIFKAVFLAGGPGSGKSFIVGKTGLVNIGMKLVNSDDEFERRLKKAGLDAGNPDDIYSPEGQAIRGKAKKVTGKRQDMYISGRLGLVLDGTGKDYNKIKKVRDELVRLGYDTAMIFVNTNLETSLDRNRKRDRSLPDAEVEKMWKGVQDNMGKFQKLFGNDFTIVDNSEGADTPGETNAAYKKMVKFANKPPKTRAAKNWISQAKSQRGIKEDINEAFEKIMTGLNEAAEYLEEKQIDALKKKSEKTGIPYGILKQVYNRGMAAWRTGHRPGTTPQQWAFARVNSFATKSKGTWGGADKDLAAKARGSMKKEEVELDEGQKPYVSSDSDGKHVMSASGKIIKSFKDMESANKYLKKNYNKLKKEEVSEADPCWDGYKQVGMKKNAAGKDVPNCVPEEVELDEKKVEFETDKDLPNLRKPKSTTDYEFTKFLMKTKSRQKDHFKAEAVSPAQQAAIAIAKKKSGKYDDEGKRIKEEPRVPRKKGQPVGSDKHSDLYTDENPEGTIHGLKFATEKDAVASVAKIKSSDRSHAHKIQAAIAMEQRARVAGKKAAAAVYRSYINDMKKKTKEMNEGADILQSPRDGIRLIVRKHTDGKRYVLKMMTQNKPGEPKILSKKDAEKQISALKRMGWKKAANEEGGAGEEGTYELVRKYKKDTPMQESDAANAAKDRHDREKERLKAKHDREMDAARLRDTRTKNMDEECGWEEETNFVVIDESSAEYQGRKVDLNNPTRSDNPKKKYMVYVKNDKGNVVKVHFGDPNMSIKRDDPERRKSFRARHGCDVDPGPKWKAKYWSCKFWSNKSVSDLLKG